MHLRNRCALVAVWILAACTPAAQAQTTLRYQFKEGDKLPYVVEQKMKTNVSIMGMNIETSMDVLLNLSLNVVEVNKDGSVLMQFKVNGAKMTMDGPTGKVVVDSEDKNEPDDAVGKILSQIVKALGGMEMTAQMLATGEAKDIKVAEATVKALQNIPGADKLGNATSADSLKTMLGGMVFPSAAVEKGKTWVNKSELKSPIGITITENTYTYEGTTETNGATLQKISVKPAIKIEPSPNAEIKIKVKDMKGSGQLLFDNKVGRLIESMITQTTEMEINAGGVDLEQRIVQTTTLRLKK